MAATATRASDQHQVGQEALAGLVPVVMAQAWPLLDVHNIQGTLPRFVAAVEAIVRRYGRASATAALQHYAAQRVTAGVPGRAPVVMPPDPASALVEDAVRASVADLYGTVTPEAEQAAMDKLNAEAEKLVLDYGRQAITDTVKADKRAKGWARVPNADACAFCLMLATRGAVYSSARAAGQRDATTKWADAKGYINSFHPNCRCTVEPVFGAYEPTARTREAQALWNESTKGLYGKDALKAFRRAVEDRSGGPTRKQKSGKAKTDSKIVRSRTGL